MRWRAGILWDFVRDFAPGTHYDELKLDDWRPAVVELAAIGRVAGGWLVDVLKGPPRYANRVLRSRPKVSQVPA